VADPRGLRAGSFVPSLLERRRRIDEALVAVVMEAYLHGISTCEVDDPVRAPGADTGIGKSAVSRTCADLDAEVSSFRDRSLADQALPYVFLDAAYCTARVNPPAPGRCTRSLRRPCTAQRGEGAVRLPGIAGMCPCCRVETESSVTVVCVWRMSVLCSAPPSLQKCSSCGCAPAWRRSGPAPGLVGQAKPTSSATI
jgi:hypothetical protein